MRHEGVGQIEVMMSVERELDVVTGQVPARREYVAAVRSMATAVGAAHELSVDAIEDLQIAVDEACTLLLEIAIGQPLEVRFELNHDHLAVSASVPADNIATIDHDSLAWTVLHAVTTDLDASVVGNCASITFTKAREF